MSFGLDSFGVESYGSTPAYAATADPQVIVELGSSLPTVATADTAWVDISPDFRTADIQRGRQSELTKVGAGTAEVVLSNADRDYDPNHTAGPYYGFLKPRRRVRIRTLYNGVFQDQYTGYLDRITQGYAPPNEATATFECSDGFSVLSGAELPASAYVAEVQADEPEIWWKLDEPQGSTVARNSGSFGSAGDGTLLEENGISAEFGVQELVVNSSGGALELSGDTIDEVGEGIILPAEAGYHLDGTQPFTVEVWIRKTEAGWSDIFSQRSNVYDYTENNIYIFSPSGGEVYFQAWDSVGFGDGIGTAAGVVQVGEKHHIVAVFESNRTLWLYVDGVLRVNSTDAAFTGTIDPGNLYLGYQFGSQAGMIVDEFAIYPEALSAERVAAHNDAGRTPWRDDTSGERLGRVLDVIDWPATDRVIDSGQSTLQSAELGVTALDHAQKVEETEGGLLFIDRSGRVRFRSRHAGFNLTSAATFGDANDGVELGYTSMEPYLSVFSIYNDVRVSRIGGVAQRAEDADSQAEFQRRTLTLDGLLHQDDNESLDRANFTLSLYSDPYTRIDQLTIDPHQSNPVPYFEQILGREIGDQVVVKRRPQGVGDPITLTARIEGMNLSIAPKRWAAEWNISPERSGEFLQLNDTDGPGLGGVRLAY